MCKELYTALFKSLVLPPLFTRLQSGQLAPLIAKSKAYYMDGRHSKFDSPLDNCRAILVDSKLPLIQIQIPL